MQTFLSRSILAAAALLGLQGCAHSYFYLPEIAGDAASHGRKGGIVYSIPPSGAPELAMRVRSLGIEKIKETQYFGIRMSFRRPKGGVSSHEFLKPEEQILRLGGEKVLHPAFVHSDAKRGSLVELTGQEHAVVELLYALPAVSRGARDLVMVTFQWRLHLGDNNEESQTARFDRYDAAPQQAGTLFPDDPDYPYDLGPGGPYPGWPNWQVIPAPYWWSVDPWWP